MSPTAGDRLESWKEIAAYLNRGVRTVRRWEAEEGLPVHRHVHRTQGTVYAFKSEIDAWRAHDRASAPTRSATHDGAPAHAASIAVLPFANLSADPENEYFADGLTDEVTADLCRVLALRVTSRTSAMTFKGTAKDVRTIASELGVRYVLEGAVRKAGARLRVTAQLIDATADVHLWADKFDGGVEDVFAIQERLARSIVDALQVRLTSEEEQRLAARPVSNVVAYECYLRARQEAWRWRKDAIEHAIQLLRNGIELVGDDARLYAALGLANLQLREAGVDLGPRPLDEAEACARKVASLDPASAPGAQLRGWINYSRGRIQDAVHDLKEARRIEPNNPDTLLLLANCYLISGRVAEMRSLIDLLMAIDPLTPLTRSMPAWADVLEGRFESAVEPYHRMFAMDPANPMARLFYVWILVMNRRRRAVAETVAGFPAETANTVPAAVARFLAHALAGQIDAAMAEVTPEIEAVATATDMFPRFLAQGFALAGLPGRAIDWLEIAVERGFINYPFLARHDPFFADLRTHPRFVQLMETVRGRWEAFEA